MQENPSWFAQDASGNFTERNGWDDVVDLNFDHPSMRIALIDAMEYWVNQFNIDVNQDELIQFFQFSKFAPTKRNEKNLFEKLEVRNNFLYVNTSIDSYLAADLAEFIRQKLIQMRKSFTYETVMSHPSKIDFMKFAMEQGFKVYL
jgi:glycosidase